MGSATTAGITAGSSKSFLRLLGVGDLEAQVDEAARGGHAHQGEPDAVLAWRAAPARWAVSPPRGCGGAACASEAEDEEDEESALNATAPPSADATTAPPVMSHCLRREGRDGPGAVGSGPAIDRCRLSAAHGPTTVRRVETNESRYRLPARFALHPARPWAPRRTDSIRFPVPVLSPVRVWVRSLDRAAWGRRSASPSWRSRPARRPRSRLAVAFGTVYQDVVLVALVDRTT